MSAHKYFDIICCIILAVILVLTGIFLNGEAFGIQPASRVMGYEDRLFDYTEMHTIDITAEGWEDFLKTCTNEEYIECSAVIDGETYKNIAIRAKGNTSLSSVQSYGNDRYSFKIEFDHYDSSMTYHGLDKLCLNNIIQDNTYMKDFVVYQMMNKFGANAPLCSFAYITVNGEDWGLYLAVEAIEQSFLQRNYGADYGELYKPDSTGFGGGRGNGKDFDMDGFMDELSDDTAQDIIDSLPEQVSEGLSESFDPSQFGGGMGEMTRPDGTRGGMGDNGRFGGGMGSDDVKLQYIDDDPDSYSNIFNNAKTDVSDADKARLISSLKKLSEGDTSAVDEDAVMRYFVVHNFVCNGDSYTGNMIHNYYLYEEDGVMSMLPWDYNLAFGGFDGSNATSAVNSPVDTPVSGGTGEDRPMAYWIFSDEEELSRYHEHFTQFIADVCDSGWLTELIDSTAELIAPYVEKDPSKFCTYEQFEKGVLTLKEFCRLRAESVSGQLAGIIPATTEGQSGSSILVDASAITISDMGSMGRGMGGNGRSDGGMGRMLPPDIGKMPDDMAPRDGFGIPVEPPAEKTPPVPAGESAPADDKTDSFDEDNISASENSNVPSGDDTAAPMRPTNGSSADRAPPSFPDKTENAGSFGGVQGASKSAAPADNMLWLGGSVSVLIAGILFAKFYKR